MKRWLTQHREAAADSLRRLSATPLNTLLGALVLGIAMALPAGGEMLLTNLMSLARNSATTPELSVFMALDAGKKDAADVEARLSRHPLVQEVRFIPRDEALRRLKTSQGLGDVIDSLPRNPFPDAFVVVPRADTPQELESMRADFAKFNKVEHVQLDSAWVKKLDALLRLARFAIALLAGLLGVALVAVTFNTIRLQILTRSAEVEVARLLGATDSFIRRPLYYFGALQGLAGGVVAWLLVFAATLLLKGPVGELAALYGLEFSLRALPPTESLTLLGAAVLLGWLGAWLSLGRHLRAGETA